MATSLTVKILGDAGPFKKASAEATGAAQGFASKASGGFSKLSDAGTKLFKVLSGGALAAGLAAVKFGSEEEDAHAKLTTALKNSGQSWAKQSGVIEAADKASEKFGYTTADTETALAQLETSTGSTSQSLKLLTLAQNLAAAKGVPLAAASIAVTKASQGQLRPLKQLGIDLPIAAGGALKVKTASDALAKAQNKLKQVQNEVKSGVLKGTSAFKALQSANDNVTTAQSKLSDAQHAGGDILGALSTKLKGQASAASETFAGKIKALKAEGEDLAAKIGIKLIPIIETLTSDTVAIVGWFEKHKAVAIALGAVVGTVAAAMLVAAAATKAMEIATTLGAVATKAAAAAQWLWNIALDDNPIGAVVLAVGLFVGGLVLLYKNCKPVRDGIEIVWKIIQSTFGWVQDHWPLLLAILTGPIGLAVIYITSHWDTIRSGAANVVGDIKNFFLGIPGFILGLEGRFLTAASRMGGALLHGILSGLGSAVGAVGGFVEQIASAVKDLINKYILDPIRGVDIKWGGFHGVGAFDIKPFGFIPRLHSGGVFQSGQGEGLALLKDGETVRTTRQESALRSGNGISVIVNVAGSVRADKDLAKVIKDEIIKLRLRGAAV